MEILIFLGVMIGICVLAGLLGLRDQKIQEKALLMKLKKNYGQAPNREYKPDDLDHIPGFYRKHKEEGQLDDTTWNDLNMDGVFARLNYCLSAAGEEYLYYLLHTPKQEDDFEKTEKHVEFFRTNDEARLQCQKIFAKMGRRIRYSIFDYMDYLDGVDGFSNAKHYAMLLVIAVTIVIGFFNFGLGFVLCFLAMFVNVFLYFRQKAQIEPYLASYAYILRVIYATDYFDKVKYDEISEDLDRIKAAVKKLRAFTRGSFILMANPKMSSGGNPADVIFDYMRMVTHIDLIKFNQMYKQIMEHKDDLDTILEVTGRLESEISIACYRQSMEGSYCIPSFEGDSFVGEKLIHPLIADAVPNDISADKGILITGSNASGKSTFLKTCAINAVLAQTIHTALSASYKAPLFRIYSSMALKDDLFEGDSYYIVEIKSIKRILDAAANGGNKVLCFVDEVLRGTNTVERIAASTEILKTFAKEKVMCFAATHDIELTSLLAEYFGIYHFEGNVTDNDVHFDYKIKTGPATNRNAIKLLGVLGYDEDIVDSAQKMAENFLATGNWA